MIFSHGGFFFNGDLMARPTTQLQRMKTKSNFWRDHARKCTRSGKDKKCMAAKIEEEYLEDHIEEIKEEMWNWYKYE